MSALASSLPPARTAPVTKAPLLAGDGVLETGSVPVGEVPAVPGTVEDRLLHARLMVSDDIVMESQSDTHVVVVHLATGTRTRLSQSAYRFVRAFQTPGRLDQIVAPGDLDLILPKIRLLLAKRLLCDADRPDPEPCARLRSAVAYKFCNAPALVDGNPADFVVLGVPYDLAGDTDSRLAPGLIRQKSLDYPYRRRFGDGHPQGWFDADCARWILEGATIADAGDVLVDHGECRARFEARVGAALAALETGRSIPVILGGDRGVTAAAVRGLRGSPSFGIVQITTDPARAAAEGAGRQLLDLPHVRQLVHCDGSGTETVETGVGSRAVSPAAAGDLAVYLSIDLAGLASPNAEGLKACIRAIGARHPILAIDLVGIDMQARSANLTGILACHLALTAMHAARDRGQE